MTKAIVTIDIGDSGILQSFIPSWNRYAEIHGYDVIVIREPIRQSELHPSWQKLLILDHPDVQGYDQILFLDHDVMVNADAPCIFESMDDPTKIGLVTWKGSYHADPSMLDNVFRKVWKNNGFECFRGLRNHSDILSNAGYDPITDDWTNMGVFTCTPDHADLLRSIYEEGTSRGEVKASSLEAVASIYHLLGLNSSLIEPLDRRFNVIWSFVVGEHYPFIGHGEVLVSLAEACVRTAFGNCFFMHFLRGPSRRYASLIHQQELALA